MISDIAPRSLSEVLIVSMSMVDIWTQFGTSSMPDLNLDWASCMHTQVLVLCDCQFLWQFRCITFF